MQGEIETKVKKVTEEMAKAKTLDDVTKIAEECAAFLEAPEVELWFLGNMHNPAAKKFGETYWVFVVRASTLELHEAKMRNTKTKV